MTPIRPTKPEDDIQEGPLYSKRYRLLMPIERLQAYLALPVALSGSDEDEPDELASEEAWYADNPEKWSDFAC